MKLLYIGDAKPETAFVEILDQNKIQIRSRYKALGRFTGKRHFYRHMHYFLLAAHGVMARKNHDVIFIWQQYIGIYYYLLTKIFPFHKRPAVLFYLIFHQTGNGLFNRAKKYFFKKTIEFPEFKKIIFTHSRDIFYKKTSDKKKALLTYADQPSDFIESNIGNVSEKYDFFSGGVTNRKYTDILEIAKARSELGFTIAGVEKDKKSLGWLPGNLKFVTGAYGNDFERLILESRAVIIPLAEPHAASGQLVILRALQAGKVVIVTRNSFMDDWMQGPGEKDFVYQYDSFEQLAEIVDDLDDKQLRQKGRQARQFYLEHLCPEKMYEKLAAMFVQVKDKCPK
jgi:glycosyltransferase involved in cell wall biosynthesis